MLRGRVARWRFEQALAALARAELPALRQYAEHGWPAPDCPVSDAPLLALDFELDGLSKGAHLLQAGWVPFSGRRIALAQGVSRDIRSGADLDARAVVIHGIGEQRAARGEAVDTVVTALIEALAGRVMVAHAAGIERSALHGAVKKLFGAHLPLRLICTLTLERRLHPNLAGPEAYRLMSCRKRYGLPEYAAHDALTDALAAAELFQAQLTRLPPGTTLAQLEHGPSAHL